MDKPLKPSKRKKAAKKYDHPPRNGNLLNDELTPNQVARALRNLSSFMHPIRAELNSCIYLLPSLSGRALSEVTERISILEDFMAAEIAPTVIEIRHLHERALAHLMHHYADVDPASLIELLKPSPQESMPSPKKLSPAKYKHYDAIVAITGEFLRAIGDS